MKNEQTSLLLALAAKLKREQASKKSAIESLSAAGIVTKTGKLTKSFSNLERVLTPAE
ncbi:hypothetical protein [Kordia jejudonensis]|uniref:hypothetical protein n=1 Tax=Kordia jejudonensis TaxID=1348245 RepID=UPI0012E05320|nr:hypothetical protein [Kordia jejudonensis]